MERLNVPLILINVYFTFVIKAESLIGLYLLKWKVYHERTKVKMI